MGGAIGRRAPTVGVAAAIAALAIWAAPPGARAAAFESLQVGQGVPDGEIDFGQSRVILPPPASEWQVIATKASHSIAPSGDRIYVIPLRNVVLVRAQEGKWSGLIEVGGLGESLTWAPWMAAPCTGSRRMIYAQGMNADKYKPNCVMVTSSFPMKEVGASPGVFKDAMDWLKEHGIASPEFVHLGRLARFSDGNYNHLHAYLSADVHPADSAPRMMSFLSWMKDAAGPGDDGRGPVVTLGPLAPIPER